MGVKEVERDIDRAIERLGEAKNAAVHIANGNNHAHLRRVCQEVLNFSVWAALQVPGPVTEEVQLFGPTAKDK